MAGERAMGRVSSTDLFWRRFCSLLEHYESHRHLSTLMLSMVYYNCVYWSVSMGSHHSMLLHS